ncbi:2056_t:CDS:2 [Funneliformis mosseae]|uniref:2056_t:CDS:1 n=1 Tax=Funneliformis mosseae TaxID=27381 RepID=A0A9N9H554_FUNMO|nr:2056_t:CDS:2 [Funneliformis mosseae]
MFFINGPIQNVKQNISSRIKDIRRIFVRKETNQYGQGGLSKFLSSDLLPADAKESSYRTLSRSRQYSDDYLKEFKNVSRDYELLLSGLGSMRNVFLV